MTKIKDLNKSRKGGNITGAEWIRNNKYIYENGKIELGLIQLRDVQNPTDMLRQQLISEGKEDYYVISFTSLGGTFTMQMLPIYGNANEYVTRWFSPSAQEAIELFKRESGGNIAKILKGPVDENGNIISRKGSRKGQDFTAQGITNVANAFKDITTKKIPDAIGKMTKEREGSSRSKRKGNSLAAMEVTRQILGNKSIADLTDDEYQEYLKEFKARGYSEKYVPTKWDGTPFRQGSRKGGPTHDQVYDFMEFISEPYLVTDKYFDGYDKDFNDVTNDELEKLFQELKQRFPVEYKEYTESLNDAYLGSRKGTGPLCDLGSVSGKGSRKGSTVTFKDVIDYFENLQETSPKDDDELWDEALNKFGVTTDLGKFDSSEFATYYYGSGTKSTNPIPDDMMVSGRNGSRKGTGPLCDLGSVSGKGSRPENLGSIASKIVSGRNRSIRMVGQYENEYQVDSRKGSVDSYSLISDVSREVNQEMFRSILSIYPEVHAGATVLASGKVRLYAYPSYQRNFTSNSQIVQGSDKEITVTFPDVDYMEESLHLSYSEIVDEIYNIVINEINSINYEATIGNLVNQGLFDEPVKSQ